MKLIVESGATKSDWTLLDGKEVKSSFKTEGLNFSSGDSEFLHRVLEYGLVKTEDIADCEEVEQIFFYAAGLFQSEEKDSPYQTLLHYVSERFPDSEIHLENDLMAAARALCGHKSGIACILGTGSNVCAYDGRDITRKIPSGGFILGDEGSAGALGKRFIEDYIKGLVPQCVTLAFEEKYDLSYPTIVHNVYHGASPAAYLGKFAPDILAFYDKDSYMTRLIDNLFRSFFERSLLPCLEASGNGPGASHAETIGIVGSFGYACREIIDRISKEYGITIDEYLPAPSERLLEYHQ